MLRNTAPVPLALLVVATALAGCLDQSDAKRFDAADGAAPSDTGDIIEEPDGPHPLFEMRWEDVEFHNVTLEGPDDAATLTVDASDHPLPLLIRVLPYYECVLGTVARVVGTFVVTVEGDGTSHQMDGPTTGGESCLEGERSYGDSYLVLTVHECFATTWTVDVAGDGPGGGAEVHIQRPTDVDGAQRLVARDRALHGDPCAG